MLSKYVRFYSMRDLNSISSLKQEKLYTEMKKIMIFSWLLMNAIYIS